MKTLINLFQKLKSHYDEFHFKHNPLYHPSHHLFNVQEGGGQLRISEVPVSLTDRIIIRKGDSDCNQHNTTLLIDTSSDIF